MLTDFVLKCQFSPANLSEYLFDSVCHGFYAFQVGLALCSQELTIRVVNAGSGVGTLIR